MSKSFPMSRVDRNQAERNHRAIDVVDRIREILDWYIINNYFGRYKIYKPLPPNSWFNQFHLFGEIAKNNILIKKDVIPYLPEKYTDIITENNCYYNTRQSKLLFFDGTQWGYTKSGTDLPEFLRTGLEPDLTISNLYTNHNFYQEVKSQQDKGNTHERVYKYLVPFIIDLVQTQEEIDYYPFGVVISGGMSRHFRYVSELKQAFGYEYPDHLIIWDDESDDKMIIDWFENVIRPLIDKE